jgi:hypothetical protein
MHLEILVALRLAAGRGALKALWLMAARLISAARRVVVVAISRSSPAIRQYASARCGASSRATGRPGPTTSLPLRGVRRRSPEFVGL